MKKKIYDIVFAAQCEELDTKEATDKLLMLFTVSCSAALTKGDWYYKENYSGYPGFKCRKCGEWVNKHERKICECDSN